MSNKQEMIDATRAFEASMKDAGCEKLPPALREQCEKKVEEGKKNKEKADKEAALAVRDYEDIIVSRRVAARHGVT